MPNRTLRRTLLLVPACLAAFLSAGCHSDAPIQARGEQFDTPWLMMGSDELRRDTMVGAPTQFVDDFGLLHVAIPVRNTIDKQLYVQYRVTFFAPNGLQTGVPGNGTITIPARGLYTLNAASTSPAGGPMPFRVELHYPRIN